MQCCCTQHLHFFSADRRSSSRSTENAALFSFLPEKSEKVQFIGHYLHYHKNKKILVSFFFGTLQIFSVCFLCKVPEFFRRKARFVDSRFFEKRILIANQSQEVILWSTPHVLPTSARTAPAPRPSTTISPALPDWPVPSQLPSGRRARPNLPRGSTTSASTATPSSCGSKAAPRWTTPPPGRRRPGFASISTPPLPWPGTTAACPTAGAPPMTRATPPCLAGARSR